MRPKTGIEIESVRPDSPADEAGLLPGDVLLSINAHPLRDALDFMFHNSPGQLDMEFCRGGLKNRTRVIVEEGNLGLTVKPFKVKTCKNNCLFCFVKQLPKGLRKALYIKDED